MDERQFSITAAKDSVLGPWLREVAVAAGEEAPVEGPQRFGVTGVDVLLLVAAYALFRWVKDCFDHRRGLNEVEILRRQEMVIAALIADGFPPPRARAVAAALLDRIAKRGMDDPALKTALSLLEKTD